MKKETQIDHKEIVISMIVDDLKLYKHFHHLYRAGFDRDRMGLAIHLNVFKLIGFTEATEQLKEWYFEKTERVIDLNFHQRTTNIFN